MDIQEEGQKASSTENEMSTTVGPEIAALWNTIIREAGSLDGPVPWSAVLSRLFTTHAPARAYAQIVPLLNSLADPDDLTGTAVHLSDRLGNFPTGSILESQIIAARRLAQNRSGSDILCAQDLLFFGILRCATRASEIGQSMPQFQGNALTAERLTLLAFEIAILSLGPDDNAKALAEYDDTRLGLGRLLPTADDPGTTRSAIRRRMRKADIDIVPIEPSSQGVALVLRDDPWAPGLQDRSGAEAEIAAFAAMFTARGFQPPLAVGVFGDWGVGKSFFMRMLHDAVEDYVAPEADDPDTLQHVVQIHFNAWHYAETNLWASIVDRIFTELDGWTQAANAGADASQTSLVEQLDTSRKLAINAIEPLVAARRKQSNARDKFRDAAKTLATKRAEVAAKKSTLLKATFDTVLQDKALKKRLDDAANTLGLEKLNENVEGFRAATQSLNDQAFTTRETVGALLGRLGCGRGLLVCASVLLVPFVIASALPAILLWFLPSLTDQIGTGASLVAGLSGMLAIAAGTLRTASRHTAEALETIRTFENNLDAEIVKRSADQASAYAQAEAEAAKAEAEVDRRRDALEEATQQADRASVAFSAEQPRQRLVHFLRERVGSGIYARELGVIAAVRKDFEMLSRLMAASATDSPEALRNTENRLAIEAEVKRILKETSDILEPEEKATLLRLSQPPSKPPVTFERIILYIDDLDRCPPDQVVAVLQAIHLLLAFPLFIVVVAVDSRWVLNALDSHYNGLLNGHGNSASAMDYLEKIIQIPYRVRNIRVIDGNSMIGDLLEPFVTQSKGDQIPSLDAHELAKPDAAPESDTPNVAGAGSTIALEEPEPKLRNQLSIEAHELNLLNRIDGLLDWSPRRRLRFANSYLLSRASVSDMSETDLSNLAILLACAEEDDRNLAAEQLRKRMDLSLPPTERLERLHALCDRFSFRASRDSEDAQT